MAQTAASSIIRQIESIFDGGSVAGLSDRQLLERFTAGRDATGDAAFAALVVRHAPMVLHVCRQVIGDQHRTEDAFQVVFIVLARNARSIRDPNLLASWLYGVALRTARKAKIRHTTQRHREDGAALSGADMRLVVDVKVCTADEPAIAREQGQALHDEIDRLPRTFRTAVVLCYIEGLTVEEAAQRLRWPAGTVSKPNVSSARKASPRPHAARNHRACNRPRNFPSFSLVLSSGPFRPTRNNRAPRHRIRGAGRRHSDRFGDQMDSGRRGAPIDGCQKTQFLRVDTSGPGCDSRWRWLPEPRPGHK